METKIAVSLKLRGFPKMELIASRENMRKPLCYVKIDKENIVATDAHCLVYTDTKEFFDQAFIDFLPEEGIYIHPDD